MIFSVFKKIGFLVILGPPYCGIGATIRIGREMLCLPYAGFFSFLIVSGVRAKSKGAYKRVDLEKRRSMGIVC